MQKQQKIILIIGVVLAIAAIVMTFQYIDQQRKMISNEAKRKFETMQANQIPVLIAKADIPKGAAITQDSFDVAMVPNQFVQPQAVTSFDRIAGMMAIAPITKGEQISLSKLMAPKEAGGGTLAMATPIGKRAHTISLEDKTSIIAGMIRPGDYVDVTALMAIPVQGPDGKPQQQPAVVPLFQNVLVLAIGQETGSAPVQEQAGRYSQPQQAKEPSSLVTLALTPQESNLLAFVQEQSKIRLVLRSPSDARIEEVSPSNWDTLFAHIMPQAAQQAAQQEKPVMQKEPQPIGQIEVYRGLKKEKVLLYDKDRQ